MKYQNILSVETSCDDTSIALLKDYEIITNVVISSSKIQNQYGGVVPEVAAREHEKNIIKAYKQVNNIIEKNNMDINLIAYTYEPGLRVCLNVGESFATTLSSLLNIPTMKINHIYAHIFSFYDELNKQDLEFPFLSLVASGGHTTIFLVNSPSDIKILNETLDDAVGEVYDKIARSLNLGYPGGPAIDNLFDESKATIKFINHHNVNMQFSFSGLKTTVLNYINSMKMKDYSIDVQTIASSFQRNVVDILIDKLKYYMDYYKIDIIAIGGGVAANSLLQQEIKRISARKIFIPKKVMCGDNAAMIAIYSRLLLDFNM